MSEIEEALETKASLLRDLIQAHAVEIDLATKQKLEHQIKAARADLKKYNDWIKLLSTSEPPPFQLIPPGVVSPDRGIIDYRRLHNLLAAKKWRQADSATHQLMIEAMGRQDDGWLSNGNVKDFPCDILRIIDGFWTSNSGGKFGFSVQKRIYLECGGQVNSEPDHEIWEEFFRRVGWSDEDGYQLLYSDFQFTIEAPEGHLPCPGKWEDWESHWEKSWVLALYNRVHTCSVALQETK